MRDASPDMADTHLKAREEAWPADTGVAASPYREKFRQGATLVPRRLVIVEHLPVIDRLGGNPKALRVRGPTSKQDKAPWKSIPPLEGPVVVEFLRPVYLGESIAPYRVLSHVTGVIPWNPNTKQVMDRDGAYAIGKQLLARSLTKDEKVWDGHGSRTMTWKAQCDYFGKLGSQFPLKNVGSDSPRRGVRLPLLSLLTELGSSITNSIILQ